MQDRTMTVERAGVEIAALEIIGVNFCKAAFQTPRLSGF